MIDFHTHILPGIDDGSSSVEESVRMLEMLEQQGVKKALLTPHFYAYSSTAEDFSERRESALRKLVNALQEKPVNIDLYLGCEVLFFEELWRIDNLESFCIKGTNYIMVEMPFSPWTSSLLDSMGKLVSKGYIPVVAHFERYLRFRGNVEKLYELAEMGALLQMNCAYINKFFTRTKALRFIKKGYVFAIGTDCHNLSDRKPDYVTAAKLVKNKLGEKQYTKFVLGQSLLLKNAEKVFSANKL